jgi:hypothetical protein
MRLENAVEHHFTRRQLYELIWTDPVKVVAARLGLSDVGLAKACHAHAIPIPARGYWTRLRAGRPVERRALSARPFGKKDRVQIGRMTPKDLRVEAAALEESALVPPAFEESVDDMTARACQLVGEVRCSKSLEHCHPAIAQLLADNEVRRLERMETPHSRRWQYQTLDSSFERRRLRILNAIFWALARCGAVPSFDKHNGRTVRVLVGDMQVMCRLGSPAEFAGRESVNRVPRTLTRPLRFMISGWYGRPNADQVWQDTTSRREVETMLADITVHILTTGEFRYRATLRDRHEQALRRRAASQTIEQQKLAEEERQRRAYLSKLAQDRVNDLLAMAARWSQARDLRAFVQAVKAIDSDILILPPPTSQKSWVRWALDLADELDPLLPK